MGLCMGFYPLEKSENLVEGYKRVFEMGEQSLLLIRKNRQNYLIENRCGHVGVALNTGKVEGETIVCSQHGISFSLNTGEIVNRPYENADPIKVFKLTVQNGYVGIFINTD